VRGFREEAVLGKCTFCQHKVTEGDKGWQSLSARITYGRWICGSCLIGMKDGVDIAIANRAALPTIEDVSNSIVKVNPETGKLEVIRKKDE
tara:strand:- start:444 stop:716 length:273 start_codon:yes stop_codon:yes gene_type:complete